MKICTRLNLKETKLCKSIDRCFHVDSLSYFYEINIQVIYKIVLLRICYVFQLFSHFYCGWHSLLWFIDNNDVVYISYYQMKLNLFQLIISI